MLSYVEIALVNAILILPLAAIAAATGRICRRPALTHLLWVIVLIRLLTPPLWQVPLVDHSWVKSTVSILVPSFLTESVPLADSLEELARQSSLGLSEPDTAKSAANAANRPRTLAKAGIPNRAPLHPLFVSLRNLVQNPLFPQFVAAATMAIWALGGILWFSIQGWRCIRFRWLLSKGTMAPPALQQMSNEAAARLGMPSSPDVWLMNGAMSPMLWGTGQSSLLIFPERLLGRLDDESTQSLLMHELAHFRRRDHLVRIIALLVTGFYWWHPVVWWARREIEASEEECCDAIVVHAMTAPPKRYAEAILETIDFLAQSTSRLPPLATGLGQFPFLRQRLTWIMRGPRRQDMGYVGRLLFLVLACQLPLQPTWLQSAYRPDQKLKPKIYEPDSEMIGQVHTPVISPAMNEPMISSRWTGLELRCQSADKRFAVLGNDSTHILIDLESGRDFDLTPFDITAVAFSADTNQFVTLDGDRFLRLWDADMCDVLQTWQVPGRLPKSVDISADGRWIVTGGNDGVVRIWNQTSQRPARELPRELSSINCVRFSPDGKSLAVATGDLESPQTARIVLLDVGSWTEQISMNWSSPTAVVAFRSAESLVSADWQGRIANWNLKTGELMGYTVGASTSLLTANGFSADASQLIDIAIPELNLEETGEGSSRSAILLWQSNSRSSTEAGLKVIESPVSSKK